MPDAIITSTASTFGTISGTFAADQSTIVGTVAGSVVGTLTGSVGVPGPVGPAGPGSTWGGIVGTISDQTDLWTQLGLKAPLASPVFTGDARAVTAALGDNDTSIATTAFVQQELLSGTANAKNLEVYVRNQTGSTLTAGTIVYINGATGNRPTVTKAQANNDANSAQTFGFVKTSIANNGFGYVIVRGELENIDTSALTEGVQLYLSPTTAGTWTTTKPSAPQHLVYVGICVRAHPTQGVILVAVQNGYELNELHDVQIVSPTNGQVLKYNSSTSLWYNGLDVGVPAGGSAGQFLQKIDGTDYNTDWVTVNLGAYAVKANNLSDLTNFSTARDNLGLGSLSNPTFAGVTVQGSGANVANLTPTSLSLTHATSGSFTIQPSVGITFPDATVQTTAFTGSAPAYITSVSSPLSVTSGNLTVDLSAYLTSATAASTYQTLSGMSSYLTTSAAASTYAPIASPTFTGNVSLGSNVTSFTMVGGNTITIPVGGGNTVSSTLENRGLLVRNSSNVPVARFQEQEVLIPSVGITFSDASVQTSAGISAATAASTYYLQTNPAGYITSAAISGLAPLASPALTGNVTITTNSASPALFIEQSGTGNILTLHDQASDTTFVAIDQSGKIGTIASTTANAGLNVPHGTAPTTPVNGDLWTTTSGLFARINGATRQYVDFDGTQTINGNKTFSNATLVFGNSTAASTTGIATGATISGSTKAVTIGTNGVAGSTTNITIGSTTGTSTTTLQGTTNGVTAAADTNSVALATTAYVVGQAGSATPLVNGTAAVGTSLRYARQDHVHPSDTTRLATANNLSELTDTASTARTNIGLGTISTVNDAPSDGSTYGRNNGAWVVAGGGGGGGTDYQAYTTPGTFTWTKPANAKWVEVVMFGGGGGGGSGARYATTLARAGGGSGAGGGYLINRIQASALGATQSVVVGAGGTGGNAVTVDSTSGNPGGQGGNSTFSIFTAWGGGQGQLGGATGGAGGSARAGWFNGASGSSSVAGAAGAATTGGTGAAASAVLSFVATGGGGGAGAGASSTTAAAGGAGGLKTAASNASGLSAIAGGAGGTTAGVAPTAGTTTAGITGTGGGGGAYITATAGQSGAAGGFPAGGGGGGSASDNGFASGAGGAGGGGAVYIITYC